MTQDELIHEMGKEIPISNWMIEKIVMWLFKRGIIKED